MLTGAGKVLADVAAIGVILGLLSSGVVWLIGSDRAQAVAGYDGAAPRALGYFSNRLGTPIGVNLLSGVVATVVLILTLTLTSGNAAKYFSVTLGLVISMVTITYVLIFPAVIKFCVQSIPTYRARTGSPAGPSGCGWPGSSPRPGPP